MGGGIEKLPKNNGKVGFRIFKKYDGKIEKN